MRLLKVTAVEQGARQTAAHGRWYDDACGAAFAMELVGERWSLLIVRELMFGGRRFTDLRRALPAISARVLGERLEGMEAAGIVQRRELPPPLAVRHYELTPWGYAADEALLALCRWALCGPERDLSLPLSPAALMMSLRALFAAKDSAPLSAEIQVGDDAFFLTIADGRLAVVRGGRAGAQFLLAAPDTAPLKRLIYGKRPLAEVTAMGLEFSGDRAALAGFVSHFELPAKVG